MQWVQWMNNKKPLKVHATCTGVKTLCNRVVSDDLCYNERVPPKDKKHVCLFCQKIAEEVERFENRLG